MKAISVPKEPEELESSGAKEKISVIAILTRGDKSIYSNCTKPFYVTINTDYQGKKQV